MIRINPGNYADSKKFAIKEYTDDQYAAELARIEEKFTPLVKRCLELGRALRIGTNHGSLSDRIMNRYGDTPLGMVESALEFARICRKHDFHNFKFSMKSSNPKIMIQCYRLLVARLEAENSYASEHVHRLEPLLGSRGHDPHRRADADDIADGGALPRWPHLPRGRCGTRRLRRAPARVPGSPCRRRAI